ncbi:MAG: hypothetical protein NTY48_03345 [Candidatus Diapherotrites archaeon]|nr:hypothetical protein [Candidatus Diapherotrites archaeon]
MKQIFALTIAFALILVMASAYAATPTVTQVTYNPSPAVPGTTITLLIQAENKDSTTQKGVSIQILDEYPFTVKENPDQTNPRNLGDLGKYSSAQAVFTIYVDPTAENKTYNLPISITTTENQNAVKTTYPIIISGKEPSLKVIAINDEKLLPGQEEPIQLTIQNIGTSPAYDIIVEMQEDRTITATGTVVERDITPLGAATAYIQNLNPAEKKSAELRVSVSNTAAIKNYTLPIKISYRNGAGIRTTDTSYIGIKVYGSAELDATLKEIIPQTNSNGAWSATVEIFNKGLGKAEFTTVTLNSKDASIDKPKQFIGTLGPNDVDTAQSGITFNTPGDHTIEVTIEYQDADATMKKTIIQVPIKAQETTNSGASPLLIIIIVVVLAVIVWNFTLRKKKK